MDTGMSFVNLNNARTDEQRQIMEKIKEEEYCPFCPEYYSKSKLEPIIKQGKHWHIRKNRWPYKNTRVHLIFIHNIHIERISEISPGAAEELFDLAKWAEKKYRMPFGAIGLRFGDIHKNGATVLHLHVHMIAAKITNRDNPGYLPVRFRMG